MRGDVVRALKNLGDSEKLLRQIALGLFPDTRKRIFTDGIKSEGGRIITSYSTTPLYVPSAASSKISPLGKNKKSAFKSGKKKKSRYIPGGYAELKVILGREQPLELTGQFLGAYSFEVGKTELIFGFQDTQRKTFASGVRKASKVTNKQLRMALEGRYGVFTALSAEEDKKIDTISQIFLDNIG